MGKISGNYIQSEIFSDCKNILHGATTRVFNSGFSPREEDIMNLVKILGSDFQSVVYLDQVHSSDVFVIENESSIKKLSKKNEILFQIPEIDAVVAKGVKKVLIIICTADCVPVLLYDKNTDIYAGVHAGWKGTLGRILEKTIKTMIGCGASAESIRAWIAPAINSCCYEVSESLIKDFQNEFSEFTGFTYGRYLDLITLNKMQAIKCGIKEENLESSGYCTLCSKDDFHSYRSKGKMSGRILTFFCVN